MTLRVKIDQDDMIQPKISTPEDKPESCEAADAEGMNVPEFLTLAQQITPQKEAILNAPITILRSDYYFDDHSPMPADLIAPRVLTPGGLLLLGGAPKVGKTDFLLNWLIHMAAGIPFLGMTSPRPLKILYLQAELQYHYMRERLQQMKFDPKYMKLVRKNLFITPQTRVLLNEKGVETVYNTIARHFDPSELDIIVIDSLRNFFDGDNENDNTEMMTFLRDGVIRLRNMINPNVGIILVHHTRKITKALLEEDPFNALSGASSLRCLCTSCILLFRPDEKKSPRKIFFEFRYGERISAKIMDTIDGQWVELENTSERLVNKNYGKRLDIERRRKHDVILQLLFDEALKGQLYIPTQFSQTFENKEGLGGCRTIMDRIDVLATKGYIKFKKIKGMRNKYGFMTIEGMEVPTGEEIVNPKTGKIVKSMRPYLPTHYKDSRTGAILPVENPSVWVYKDDKN